VSKTDSPSRPCPVCAGTQSAAWARKGGLSLVRCAGCGLVFASPLPGTFGSGEYYEAAGAAFYLSADKLAGDHSPVRYERELKLFRSLCPGGRVLDVGCGTGGFLHQLRQRFPGAYDVLGTDIAGPALDHAEALGVPVHRGSFLDAELPAESFDAITFWAVLEHLPEPGEFLREAARLLKPGGVLVALVPNFDSLAVRLLGVRYRYVLPQHLNYFTARTLAQCVAGTPGLEVTGGRWMHFNPVVLWQDWRRDGAEVSDAERAQLLARTTALKQGRANGLLKAAYAAVEWTLGRLHLADNVVVVARRRR
jgi:SAM-dependent methyltransferase